MKRSIVLLLLISICLSACSAFEAFETPETQVPTDSIELNFLTTDSEIEIQAGEQYEESFIISSENGTADVDVQLVSSNPNVASATIEKTTSSGLSHIIVDAYKAGTTDIYIQTADGSVKSDKITITVQGYIYNIDRVDDASVTNAVRKSLFCTADKEYIDSLDKSEIEEMVKYISRHYADTHQVNAVTSFLSYSEDYTGEGFTVASCLYAPFADISKAGDVNTGDYTDFDYKITLK